jgi:tetratricopeptide (TPR) repeat protein
MTGDNDLQALLPDPPPPAPKRREAAIDAALARFDGVSPPASRPRSKGSSLWATLRRPQAGLLATAALIAAISLPYAWTGFDRQQPVADEQPSLRIEDPPQAPKLDVAAAPLATPAPPPPPPRAAPSDTNDIPSSKESAAPSAKRVQLAQAPAPPAPPPPAMQAYAREDIVVQGRAADRRAADTPVALSVISSEKAAGGDREIIVTGASIGKSATLGDWNACTLDDPRQELARCRKLVRSGSKDARTQAEASLAEGLRHGWNGDTDEAIAAFDRAIATVPQLSLAWLNRGLAHDRRGNVAQAIVDLDKAVRYAPRAARGYYQRSLLLRKSGKIARARADEKRAVELDPLYADVVE